MSKVARLPSATPNNATTDVALDPVDPSVCAWDHYFAAALAYGLAHTDVWKRAGVAIDRDITPEKLVVERAALIADEALFVRRTRLK